METTKKLLRLALFISLVQLSFRVSAANADTLKGKNYIGIEVNYGIPVYNSLTLDKFNGFSKQYKVNSKLKSCGDIKFSIARGKNLILLGACIIQSDFKGDLFNTSAGVYSGTSYQYTYTMYQRIKYNVYYFSAGYGLNIKLGLQHTLSPSAELLVPLRYDFKIDNYYGAGQTSDTTKYIATKNANNKDTDFGRFPRFRLGLSYMFNPTEHIGIRFNLSFIYAVTLDRKEPDFIDYSSVFNQSNKQTYLAYTIKNQSILLPSIGLHFKLKK